MESSKKPSKVVSSKSHPRQFKKAGWVSPVVPVQVKSSGSDLRPSKREAPAKGDPGVPDELYQHEFMCKRWKILKSNTGSQGQVSLRCLDGNDKHIYCCFN